MQVRGVPNNRSRRCVACSGTCAIAEISKPIWPLALLSQRLLGEDGGRAVGTFVALWRVKQHDLPNLSN